MSSLAQEIIQEIQRHADPTRAQDIKHYFREPVETWGLKSPQQKEIAKKYYPRVKGDLDAALALTEELLQLRNMDYSSVALRILQRFEKKLESEHFPVFDRWVDYLDNWATTDQLCNHIVASTIRKDPGLTERLLEWTGSENRWRRRSAAVSLVPIARRGDMLEESLRIADHLMTDEDDMVQKGVGWLLKEASKKQPEEIRAYLLQWRLRTSSLVLRYASEKLPRDMQVLKTRY